MKCFFKAEKTIFNNSKGICQYLKSDKKIKKCGERILEIRKNRSFLKRLLTKILKIGVKTFGIFELGVRKTMKEQLLILSKLLGKALIGLCKLCLHENVLYDLVIDKYMSLDTVHLKDGELKINRYKI